MPSRATALTRRLVVAVVLFIAAGLVGRATVIDGQALSLIWPASAVAALWIGSARTKFVLTLDLIALGTATFAVNHGTGAPTGLALVFVATNIIQVLTFVALVRAWVPGLWGFGGTAPLNRLADVGRLTTAAVLACGLGACLGAAGLWALADPVDGGILGVWWGRNSIAMIVLVTLVVQLGEPLAHSPAPLALIRRAITPSSARRLLEALALGAASALVFTLVFEPSGVGRPLSFLLLVVSVWAGLRFSAVAATAHGLAMGVGGVVFTLKGLGPFAAIESMHYRALVGQVFVAMAVLTGLSLAFSRAERNQANRELAAARRAADERAQLLDAVLESMKESIVVLDHDGSVILRNRAGRELAELFGQVHDRIQSAETYGFFHANGLPVLDEELPGPRALRGESVDPTEYHVRLPGHGGCVLEVTAQPLTGTDPNEPCRALVNSRDVTAEAEHRDTLASFAGVIAHDLINPLSVVDGWTETLGAEFALGPVPPVVGTALVGRIHDAAEHMRAFIADLLAYTVARDHSLRLGPVDISAIVAELAAMRATTGVEPCVAVAPGLSVWADQGLVRQLLDNLIGNAVKYVAPGVRPRVEITAQTDGDWLELRVADNGIGIPEEQLELVFENFHRAHASDFRGTGLGLAICRRIVDRHGGTITAAPGADGVGTVFTFRLPRVADAIPESSRAGAAVMVA